MASRIQVSSFPQPPPRIMPRNRITNARMTAKPVHSRFRTSTRAAWRSVSMPEGLMHRAAATTGEIRQPLYGSCGSGAADGWVSGYTRCEGAAHSVPGRLPAASVSLGGGLDSRHGDRNLATPW